MDKLVDFFIAIYDDGSADYYGVAVEDDKIVEWSAAEDAEGNGGVSDNYFAQLAKYGDPRIVEIDEVDVDAARDAFDELQHEAYMIACATLSGRLVGFIYYRDYYDTVEYYGVAVKNGEVVEWYASCMHDGTGVRSDNYNKMVVKYGDPTLFDEFEPNDYLWDIWEKFEQKRAELLNTAKEEVARQTA